MRRTRENQFFCHAFLFMVGEMSLFFHFTPFFSPFFALGHRFRRRRSPEGVGKALPPSLGIDGEEAKHDCLMRAGTKKVPTGNPSGKKQKLKKSGGEYALVRYMKKCETITQERIKTKTKICGK